jgi:hypothetical protein
MTTKKALEPPAERGAAAAAVDEPDETGRAGEAAAAAAAADDAQAADAFDDTPTSADYSTAFSPRNVAVGLAIVAGLVAFAASRRRRKQSGREDG